MIYLNIGSNLTSVFGDKFENIKKTVNELTKLNIQIIKISSFYETPSYPDNKKPKFTNICIKLKTKMLAKNLNAKILTTEKDYVKLDFNNSNKINFLEVEVVIKKENDLINFIKSSI